ncbi:MAG: V-type ATPase subunit [Oscillospiraceae bacterium]|nr:V-type ATPase subunit [Oscillospiraceae bacterium]
MAFASNAVLAKSRAVYGRRLTKEDYMRLSSMKTVADVCEYLKKTPRYERSLSDANPRTMHRGRLEELLKRAVYDVFESFHIFDYSNCKSYFKFIVARLEIEQIISAVSAVLSKSSDFYIATLPTFITKNSRVDLPSIASAENIANAAEILKKTPYCTGKKLKEMLSEAALTGFLSIPDFESALYSEYYLRLLRSIESEFHGREKKEFKTAVLKTIDMENVVTFCRMARFSGQTSKENRASLIPFKYRLSADEIEELSKEKSVEKIALYLEKKGCHGTNTETIELLTESISFKNLEKTIRLSQSPAVVYFALTQSLSIELKNIKTLTEGVRYGLNGGDILKMLVL